MRAMSHAVPQRRPHAVPQRSAPAGLRPALTRSALTATAFAAGAAALSAGQAAAPDRTLFLCPLRAVTGLPCPLCGGTTAAIALARFDLPAALAANPIVVATAVLVVLAPVAAVLGVRRSAGRVRTAVAVAGLVAAQLWQFARFDVAGL